MVFAGIENFDAGPFHFVDESRGERRDAAEALEEIERDPFPGEQLARFAADAREFVAGGHAIAALFEQFHGIEDQGEKLDAGDGHLLFGDEAGLGVRIGGDAGIGSDVARAEVFRESAIDSGADVGMGDIESHDFGFGVA